MHKHAIGRRQFAAALGSALASGRSAVGKDGLRTLPPGIKISLWVSRNPDAEELRFVRQLGIEWVNIDLNAQLSTYENFRALRERVEAAGLKLWNINNTSVRNMEAVTLNLPGRDEKIEEFRRYLQNLAKAGIFYTTYAHMGNGIWSSTPATTRGGAATRSFDPERGVKGYWDGKVFEGPLTHGRKYSAEELWDNYAYFMRAVAPVAEETGVRIGIHPDDPPAPELGGVPRCLFGSFEGYRRALELAGSPNVGVCLCCGCWLEGGKLMGKTVTEAIRYFGRRGKLFKVHFQSVSSPLPSFVETFIDDGYHDSYPILKALREVDFNGAVMPAHIPSMAGGSRAGTAFTIGYMKALLARVNAEAGGVS